MTDATTVVTALQQLLPQQSMTKGAVWKAARGRMCSSTSAAPCPGPSSKQSYYAAFAVGAVGLMLVFAKS
jgi:hypothetical protein